MYRDATVENLLINKQNIESVSNTHKREQKSPKPLVEKGKRIPQRANQKYHDSAVKTRKIELK